MNLIAIDSLEYPGYDVHLIRFANLIYKTLKEKSIPYVAAKYKVFKEIQGKDITDTRYRRHKRKLDFTYQAKRNPSQVVVMESYFLTQIADESFSETRMPNYSLSYKMQDLSDMTIREFQPMSTVFYLQVMEPVDDPVIYRKDSYIQHLTKTKFPDIIMISRTGGKEITRIVERELSRIQESLSENQEIGNTSASLSL